MFEQSVLPQPHTKQSLTFAAATGAEIVAVAIAIAVPLFFIPSLGPPPPLPPPVHFHPSPLQVVKLVPVPSAVRVPAPVRLFQAKSLVAPTHIPDHIVTLPEQLPDLPMGSLVITPSDGPIGVFGSDAINSNHPPPPPSVHVVKPRVPDAPVHVTSKLQEAKLINKVVPRYPPLALQTRQFGMVRLIATVGKDGHVTAIQVVSGPSFLVPAAVEAVKQWVYRPTVLNGTPVEVIAPIDINFILNQ